MRAQNKSKFIKIGLQEAEAALRAGKILIMCIVEKPWADLRPILEKVFMSKFWMNFLVIRNEKLLLIVMQKNEVSQNVKFDEKISSGHNIKMGEKMMRKWRSTKY